MMRMQRVVGGMLTCTCALSVSVSSVMFLVSVRVCVS